MKQVRAEDLLQMMKTGAEILAKNEKHVNALNVFPVPDGDTGTNMHMTLSSGIKAMEERQTDNVGEITEALSKGLLMGARGNSGVILSQLFRGFAKALAGKQVINARQFADAFYQGVETAYQAVIKPVEGTVLTVAREAADAGVKISWTVDDAGEIMKAIYDRAQETLAQTPEMLSVLEEVNVVDAGGQGLVYIYEGMLSAIKGEKRGQRSLTSDSSEQVEKTLHHHAQAKMDPDQIEQGYCTEFMISRTTDRRSVKTFEEKAFRQEIAQYGDSLLVVADDDWIKVHIHAEKPGDVLNYAIQFGDLSHIKIENMREQYEHVVSLEDPSQSSPTSPRTRMANGILVVAAGEGIAEIFRSLGANEVLRGGQTMNPSTEEIAAAIQKIHADHVYVLPNNKNVTLAAKQAAEMVDVSVTVIETKTIPQGMAALIAYDEKREPAENQARMQDQIASIRTGEVTYAVRDTEINDLSIQKGDYLGILDGQIQCSGDDLFQVSDQLLAQMIDEESDVVTLITGQEVAQEQVKKWVQELQQKYPDQEFEIFDGGQPLYYFLIGVE